MSKVAIVYWSGTGNTEAMAKAIEEGAKGAGAEVSLLEVESFTISMIKDMLVTFSGSFSLPSFFSPSLSFRVTGSTF